MTIATTNTEDFAVDRLLKRAAQMATIMGFEEQAQGPQWDARAAFGRDELDLILKALPASSTLTRNVEFYTVTLSTTFGGEADPIVLPSDTIDVVGEAMYRETADDLELNVAQVDREYWQASADKDRAGSPASMYVHKGAEVKLYLLPVPDVADATLRIQRKRLLADARPGTVTVDLERHWLDYLQSELAFRYAMAAGKREQAALLRAQAKEQLQAADAASKQNTPIEMVFDHPTSWS